MFMQMCFNLDGGNDIIVEPFNPATAVERHNNENNVDLWKTMPELEVIRVRELYEPIFAQLVQTYIDGLKSTAYYFDYMKSISTEEITRQFKYVTKAFAEFFLVVDEIPYKQDFIDVANLRGNSRGDLLCALEGIYKATDKLLATLTGTNTTVVKCLVRDERKAQYEKWGHQKHPASVWSLILTEELGELSQAISNWVFGEWKLLDTQDPINEAVQVCAVAHSIIEQLGGDMIWTNSNL